jgi:hypothetical protein
MTLDYSQIEAQLVEQLPELRPAVERYWQVEGPPGEDAGPYILFEGLFRPYIDTLLMSPRSETRDRLLRRAFDFTEACIRSGGELHDLGAIAVFEGQSKAWFARAEPFVGIQSRHEALMFAWPVDVAPDADAGPDLYDVCELVDALLANRSHGAT